MADLTCTVPPPIEISIPNVPLSGVGDSQTITVSVISGTVVSVTFSSGDTSVVTVSPVFDGAAAFQTTVTAQGIGSTTYNAIASDGSGGFGSDTATVTVSNPEAWWQVKEGDAVTNGSIRSNIPASCVATPSCDPVFITQDVGDYPGVPSCDGFSCSDYGSGSVSTDPPGGWNAEDSEYSSTQTYDYTFFEARIPSGVTPVNPGLTLNVADVTTGALGPAGYYWFQTSTDLQITNPGGASSVGSNKVIVFVDGNLTINGRIPVNDGTGSFLIVVSGDISVSETVGVGVGPHLEGLYITDGTFETGLFGTTDDFQLHIRGAVAALTSFNFYRELTDNSQTPGEIFEYGADQALLFPQDLADIRTIWREVAP